MIIQSAWRVIVSSRSGGGKARHDWPSIAKLLKAKSIEFSERITDHAYHAIELAREAVLAGFRKLLVIGGDGAIHEVLNGLYSQQEVPPSEVTLALIPVGSGNDWSRLHQIPFDYEQAVDLVAKADSHTRVQDVARVHTLMDGKPYCRYMMNIGGLGFDSMSAAVSTWPRSGGMPVTGSISSHCFPVFWPISRSASVWRWMGRNSTRVRPFPWPWGLARIVAAACARLQTLFRTTA